MSTTTREINLPATPSLSAIAERSILLIAMIVALVGCTALVLRALAASAVMQ